MDKTWVLCSSVFLIYVIQIQHVFAADCNITSIASPSGSTLNVTWMNYTQASVYLLDLRDGNATNVAPVVAVQSAPNTQALVQGLKPGHIYTVTLNVFHFYTVVCSYVQTALTVPDVTQITLLKAISSTSIRAEWASVPGAFTYILFVEEVTSPPRTGLIVNQTLTNTSTQVGGLSPATLYSCYVYTANSAGLSAKSTLKAIMTLVQPPVNVTLVSTGRSTARVTWSAVSKVLIYQVSVSAPYNPNIPIIIKNSSVLLIDITGLAPCTNYTVGVASLNTFLVPGNPTNATINTPGE
ncbi:fibronectin type III domain-containing protein 7-like [Betta splendens]|uniref:Fibronectin type III domain-containing protein 7-like n=1 Tax=Betta splendens TaxID=158456 RepID=A0A8M1H6Y1_BETSP|nr:fibronectin type III domain-containing protein 7-like [Betta splendens]